MLIDEGKVNFGDESPDREEIENLTSEEEDVDIEGMEIVEWVDHFYFNEILYTFKFIMKTLYKLFAEQFLWFTIHVTFTAIRTS